MNANRYYKLKRSTVLPLGVISEGTLRPEDLIPAYLDALGGIHISAHDRKQVDSIRREFEQTTLRHSMNEREANLDALYDKDLVEALTLIMENYLPDYTYFGTLEGDGACFGVWASIESLNEDARVVRSFAGDKARASGVCKIDAGDPFPQTREFSHVMSVTDHGNVTLYRRSGNHWIEVWSVV